MKSSFSNTAAFPARPSLDEIEALARQAGEILRASFGTHQQIHYKDTFDPVTDADRRSESFLLTHIQSRFPTHRILSEESGTKDGQDCCLWFVDPLDGTVNYAHRVPYYSVSIAYQEEGLIRLGVVYDPTRDECFSAERGSGAWLNGYPIRVSETAEIDQCLLTTGFSSDIRTNPETNLDQYAEFALHTQGVRRFGSAALDLCYVAAGRFDGFWELRLKPWDIAAGALIVMEAGGVVTDIHDMPNFLSAPGSILAANPVVHGLMVERLRGPRSVPLVKEK